MPAVPQSGGPDGDRFVCPYGHAIVVREGYLDASAEAADPVTARTLASFGDEWTAFDRLSAPLEARYRWDELAAWFQETDLAVDYVRDQAGWFVVGHRPERSAVDAGRSEV